MTTKKKEISKNPAGNKPHGSATVASILGRPVVAQKKNGERKVKPEWAKYHERLLELRDQLMRQMNGLAKESAQEMAGYSLHMADSGTDNFDRDFALSLLSSDQDAIYEIEEALVPLPAALTGLDSLLSIAQMPPGIPVATVAIGGAENAAILAAQVLGLRSAAIRQRVEQFRANQTQSVLDSQDDARLSPPLRMGRSSRASRRS